MRGNAVVRTLCEKSIPPLAKSQASTPPIVSVELNLRWSLAPLSWTLNASAIPSFGPGSSGTGARGGSAAGGSGCISVTANVAPALCAEFHEAIAANDLVKARALNDRLFPLHYAMFSDASPAPVKYALSRGHDWFEPDVRLPLCTASEASRKAVDEALEIAGLA